MDHLGLSAVFMEKTSAQITNVTIDGTCDSLRSFAPDPRELASSGRRLRSYCVKTATCDSALIVHEAESNQVGHSNATFSAETASKLVFCRHTHTIILTIPYTYTLAVSDLVAAVSVNWYRKTRVPSVSG